MGNYISILPEVMLMLTLAAIFVILFVTILKILRQVSFFQGKTAIMMAVSLSVLFLVALSQFLAVPGGAYHVTGFGNEVNATAGYFWLPKVAFAVAAAVVFSQVLLLASRTPLSDKPEPVAQKHERAAAKRQPPGRPKKEKGTEKESKEATKPVGRTS